MEDESVKDDNRPNMKLTECETQQGQMCQLVLVARYSRATWEEGVSTEYVSCAYVRSIIDYMQEESFRRSQPEQETNIKEEGNSTGR